MTERDASRFMAEVIQPTQLLILERNAASPNELGEHLLGVLTAVRSSPTDWSWPDSFEETFDYQDCRNRVSLSWPELGFYDIGSGSGITNDTSEELGDAIDDLADIAGDFGNVIRLAQEDVSGALSLLRFTADIHWGEHVEALVRHLLWLSSRDRT